MRLDNATAEIDSASNAILGVAWGDLSPAPWVRLSGRSTYVPNVAATLVVLAADVGEHAITNRLFRGKVVRRAATRVTQEFYVPDTKLAEAADLTSLLTPFVREAVREMSYRLREHDPRIGEMPAVDTVRDLLRRSLLFDPPRLRPPAWKGKSGLDAVPCPFCQDGFGKGYPAMWGGGNVLWVHPSCWLQAA